MPLGLGCLKGVYQPRLISPGLWLAAATMLPKNLVCQAGRAVGKPRGPLERLWLLSRLPRTKPCDGHTMGCDKEVVGTQGPAGQREGRQILGVAGYGMEGTG